MGLMTKWLGHLMGWCMCTLRAEKLGRPNSYIRGLAEVRRNGSLQTRIRIPAEYMETLPSVPVVMVAASTLEPVADPLHVDPQGQHN